MKPPKAIPPDGTKVGEVWKKSNKDGSRDKQHAENRQLQVMEYGEITFRSGSGIYEKYMCLAMPSKRKTFFMQYRHSRIFLSSL